MTWCEACRNTGDLNHSGRGYPTPCSCGKSRTSAGVTLPVEAQRIAAFEAGWRMAAEWAKRGAPRRTLYGYAPLTQLSGGTVKRPRRPGNMRAEEQGSIAFRWGVPSLNNPYYRQGYPWDS